MSPVGAKSRVTLVIALIIAALALTILNISTTHKIQKEATEFLTADVHTTIIDDLTLVATSEVKKGDEVMDRDGDDDDDDDDDNDTSSDVDVNDKSEQSNIDSSKDNQQTVLNNDENGPNEDENIHRTPITISTEEDKPTHTDTNHQSERTSTDITHEYDYRNENVVFQNMLNRVREGRKTCESLDSIDIPPRTKNFDTGVAPLPYHGLENVLKAWLESEDDRKRAGYDVCRLPPPTACNVTDYSVILMAHKVSEDKRLRIMTNGIKDLAKRKATAEIILVWNSDRSILIESELPMVKEILSWANDPSHPLRIFYALENGLENNLFNRYHPNINPSQELLMYFDDDGPFFSEEAMEAGIRLWQYNSDTQVGSFARNLRFKSTRMNQVQKTTADRAIDQLLSDSWQVGVSPNDIPTIESMDPTNGLSSYPQFTPLCPKEQGDRLEYNFFVFPDFTAHMFLPSGTLIHRDFMCFVWHPVFEQIRQYILDHPTHPDDMVMSTLLSHLSGKGLRSFPRIIKEPEKKKDEDESSKEQASGKKNDSDDDDDNDIVDGDNSKVVDPKESHRRLLWQQENWADMREEAINSVIGYFGTVNPGSIGWCVGTDYQVKNPKTLFECKPTFPTYNEIPWIQEGGLGSDKCNVVKEKSIR